MKPEIAFNRYALVGDAREYLLQALDSGHISGDGQFGRQCEELLQAIIGAPRVFLTSSGTDALEMAALLLDVGPGDEVILPSFTFPSTANAFALRGARPVFIDIRPDTLNLNEAQLEARISPRTKAIVPVHYAGVGCEMDAILEIARPFGIPVVEDNALGLFGKYKGQPLGSFGSLAALSFHETKNVTSGEGGALVVNDAAFIGRAEILREKGTDRRSFARGSVEKYSWVDVGSSYAMSDLLAAVLLAQLNSREYLQTARRQLWEGYELGLSEWAETQGVRLPQVPPHCEPAYQTFYLIMPSKAQRDAFIHHMQRHRIGTASHYEPLHLSKMGLRFGPGQGGCPITEQIAARLVRLPLYVGLGPDIERVVEVATSFKEA